MPDIRGSRTAGVNAVIHESTSAAESRGQLHGPGARGQAPARFLAERRQRAQTGPLPGGRPAPSTSSSSRPTDRDRPPDDPLLELDLLVLERPAERCLELRRIGLGRARQDEDERGTGARHGRDIEVAAHLPGEIAGDRQAESGARDPLVAGDPLEPLEDPRLGPRRGSRRRRRGRSATAASPSNAAGDLDAAALRA